ncbi:MAG: hypothetical protein QNI89_04190 [Desulfobacterales bacterium]|nr:hypothetical protein [Desulfobacterales bacterium]
MFGTSIQGSVQPAVIAARRWLSLARGETAFGARASVADAIKDRLHRLEEKPQQCPARFSAAAWFAAQARRPVEQSALVKT